MVWAQRLLIAVVLFCLPVSAVQAKGGNAVTAAPSPASWIDAKTGHRILRLSDDPGASALYFNEQAYSPQGDKMVYRTDRGIWSVDLPGWK